MSEMQTTGAVKPGVSLIVPCHNEERTLPRTLEALKTQRYPDLEVIVVDDGSVDGTADIAGRHRDFTVIRHETNRGLAAAYNTGIAASSKTIIGTLHADCVPGSELWIERCVRHFADPTVGIVGSPFVIPESADVNWVKTIFMYALRADTDPRAVRGAEAREIPFISGKCDFYRGSVLRDIGGFRALSRVAGEDKDVSLRFRKRGFRIILEPAAPVIHLYGSHQEGLIANWSKAVQYGEVVRELYRLHGTIHSRDVLANVILTAAVILSGLIGILAGISTPLVATAGLLVLKNLYKAHPLLSVPRGIFLFVAAVPVGIIDNILMGVGVLKGPPRNARPDRAQKLRADGTTEKH